MEGAERISFTPAPPVLPRISEASSLGTGWNRRTDGRFSSLGAAAVRGSEHWAYGITEEDPKSVEELRKCYVEAKRLLKTRNIQLEESNRLLENAMKENRYLQLSVVALHNRLKAQAQVISASRVDLPPQTKDAETNGSPSGYDDDQEVQSPDSTQEEVDVSSVQSSDISLPDGSDDEEDKDEEDIEDDNVTIVDEYISDTNDEMADRDEMEDRDDGPSPVYMPERARTAPELGGYVRQRPGFGPIPATSDIFIGEEVEFIGDFGEFAVEGLEVGAWVAGEDGGLVVVQDGENADEVQADAGVVQDNWEEEAEPRRGRALLLPSDFQPYGLLLPSDDMNLLDFSVSEPSLAPRHDVPVKCTRSVGYTDYIMWSSADLLTEDFCTRGNTQSLNARAREEHRQRKAAVMQVKRANAESRLEKRRLQEMRSATTTQEHPESRSHKDTEEHTHNIRSQEDQHQDTLSPEEQKQNSQGRDKPRPSFGGGRDQVLEDRRTNATEPASDRLQCTGWADLPQRPAADITSLVSKTEGREETFSPHETYSEEQLTDRPLSPQRPRTAVITSPVMREKPVIEVPPRPSTTGDDPQDNTKK